MKKLLVLLGAMFLLAGCSKSSVLKYEGVGDYANYKRASGDRTSRVISEASGYAKVTEETSTDFLMELDYRVKALGSTYEDTLGFTVPKRFFTDAFKAELRAQGSMQLPDFLITHRGYDGSCDDVTISDIQQDTSPLEDVEIDARICPGIPVIGADTFDLRAKTRGQRIKLGLNYYVP